jgi:prepilin-type N-terminal cleavage/methylation domain-containing protein/prepilin-type processing-associated H-X9-DG protein
MKKLAPLGPRARRGFTVIEMLIVVGIVAILVAFLLPALGRARSLARRVESGSYLKDLSVGITGYTHDNLGEFPSPTQWVNGSWFDPNAVTSGSIYAYTRTPSVYVSPQAAAVFRQYEPDYEPAYTFTMNAYLGGPWNSKPGIKRTSGVQEPSTLLLLAEENPYIVPGVTTQSIDNGSLGVGEYAVASDLKAGIASYHLATPEAPGSGTGNVAFVDGHVEPRNIAESKELATPKQFRP